MKTAAQVTNDITNWKTMGMTKAETAILIAEDCIGWPYVWGGYGQMDTPANRRSYADRSSCPEAESRVIISKCQVLNGSKGSCDGCKYYPSGQTRFFDCRGFTRWVLQQVGVTINGAGATSQWNDNSNWSQKGNVGDIPNMVCCVFIKSGEKMNHTGLYVGNGLVIHCSGKVKKEKLSTWKWTHYAIPKGIEGDVQVPTPGEDMPTLRKGAKGEYVTMMQTKLIQQGYSLDPYGADGSFGNTTLKAVKQYQADHGLAVDGVVGKRTWESLLEGQTTLYTVTIQHVSQSVANDIVGKYGGKMTKEGASN